jgi:hypothetical protein
MSHHPAEATGPDLATFSQERLDDWLTQSRRWYALYYGLGSLAVVFTITVASRPQILSTNEHVFAALAWVAAILQALSTFFLASGKAAAYRAAWRRLWLARAEYVDDRSEDTAKALKHAIHDGWVTIDGGYVTDESVSTRRGRS